MIISSKDYVINTDELRMIYAVGWQSAMVVMKDGEKLNVDNENFIQLKESIERQNKLEVSNG